MSDVKVENTGRYRRCELCKHLILDSQSRVIYPPGTAHRTCRDLRKTVVGDAEFAAELKRLNQENARLIAEENKANAKSTKPNK